MKRRSFLQRIGLVIAAVTTGAAALPSAIKKAPTSIPWPPVKQIGGVTSIADPWPIRYTIKNGLYVLVDPVIKRGNLEIMNPDYLSATHEVGFSFYPSLQAVVYERPAVTILEYPEPARESLL